MRQSNALPVLVLLGAASGCGEKGAAGQEHAAPRPTTSVARAEPSSSIAAPEAIRSAANPMAAAPSGNAPPAAVLAAVAAERADPAVACVAGFTPSASPRVDVVRLGVSCGPLSGLTQMARTSGVLDETGRGPSLRWRAERGDCFRLFAVAGAPVEDLEITIGGKGASTSTVTSSSRRWAVVGEQGVFCSEYGGPFEASFVTHAGSAELVATVWRGARMVSRHHPRASGDDPR